MGCDTATAVTPEYRAGARFTGKVKKLTVELGGAAAEDREMATKHAMLRQ